MTVWRYGPSTYGLTVDTVNDGVRPSFRNLGTVMTVHYGTVDGTVQKSQKGKKWPFDPILALLSSSQNVACVLFTQTNDRCSNERKNFKVFVLTRISWSQLFTAKKHLTVGLHSDYSGQPLDRLDGRHRHF